MRVKQQAQVGHTIVLSMNCNLPLDFQPQCMGSPSSVCSKISCTLQGLSFVQTTKLLFKELRGSTLVGEDFLITSVSQDQRPKTSILKPQFFHIGAVELWRRCCFKVKPWQKEGKVSKEISRNEIRAASVLLCTKVYYFSYIFPIICISIHLICSGRQQSFCHPWLKRKCNCCMNQRNHIIKYIAWNTQDWIETLNLQLKV